MKLGPHRILVFGRDVNYPALADCPPAMMKKLVKVYEGEKRARNRLAVTQVVQLFSLVFVLMLAATMEWFVESKLLRGILIPVLLGVWLIFAGLLGNRTTRLISADFIAFVRDYCPDGRPRFCIQCDYDLRASPTGQCPECGATVPKWEEKAQR